MKWSNQKQFTYGLMFLVILIVLVGVPVYFYFFNKAETCFDGKKNNNETGIDCGGICSRICTADVAENPIVLWSRAFSIANGRYNLVAYLQNPNINSISEPFDYVFNAFDDQNVLIGSREGSTSANDEKNFVVFEQAFDAGQRKINKVTFEIKSKVNWIKQQPQKVKFSISNEGIVNLSGTPTLTSNITNKTVNTYKNFYVVAIVYDLSGNATLVSRTLVDELLPSGKTTVLFTWPFIGDIQYSKIEILPRI